MKLNSISKTFMSAAIVLSTASCVSAADDQVRGWSLPGDTPMKIADPEAMRQKIDRLREQDHWTDFATPEQIALFDGPETEWPQLPMDAYDLTGVNLDIIGSPVPAPGVHPRILFSPEDIPTLRKRIVGTKRWIETEEQMKKSILNPDKGDGKVFAKLASGDTDDLVFWKNGPNGAHRFNGYDIDIYAAHVCYWPRNLNAISFYAMMKDDEELARRCANAVYNYYKLREPFIDRQNALAEDPNAQGAWPGDVWRGMHYAVGEAHVGYAYDLTAMYMTEKQKDFMRRIIVKATAGRRQYGGNAPVRWRDTNWVGWDTQHGLAHLAIEGEEGYEPAIFENLRNTVYGYFTYGISPYGTIFETNGKNPAGFQFAFNSLIAVARRGHKNLLGHPHLRKLAESQTHQVVPDGSRNVNNGTYGCTKFGPAGYIKNLYPDSPVANWLVQQGDPLNEPEDLEAYRKELAGRGRLYSIHPIEASTYLGMAEYAPVETGKTDAEGQAQYKETWERDYLNLGLDFEDPHHGQLSTRSSNEKDALFMMVEARPDLYTGGHQHHDAGHFYLAANGVNWGMEGNDGLRTSRFHSVVLIDGNGQGNVQHCAPAKAEWLGAVTNEHGAFARTDLKHAYDYIWTIPMHYSWDNAERKAYDWEPETDPEVVKVFKGTQHYKSRIWMHSYWNWNWGPTMRAKYNPVQYAYRTAGIVRGEHPYALVVDDIRKNDDKHVYEWQMQLGGQMDLLNWWKMPWGLIVLAPTGNPDGEESKTPKPRLAILVLNKNTDSGETQFDTRFPQAEIRKPNLGGAKLVISSFAEEPDFRIALVPVKPGQNIPSVEKTEDGSIKMIWSEGKGEKATVIQEDTIRFQKGDDHRTRFTVERGGMQLISVQ